MKRIGSLVFLLGLVACARSGNVPAADAGHRASGRGALVAAMVQAEPVHAIFVGEGSLEAHGERQSRRIARSAVDRGHERDNGSRAHPVSNGESDRGRRGWSVG